MIKQVRRFNELQQTPATFDERCRLLRSLEKSFAFDPFYGSVEDHENSLYLCSLSNYNVLWKLRMFRGHQNKTILDVSLKDLENMILQFDAEEESGKELHDFERWIGSLSLSSLYAPNLNGELCVHLFYFLRTLITISQNVLLLSLVFVSLSIFFFCSSFYRGNHTTS